MIIICRERFYVNNGAKYATKMLLFILIESTHHGLKPITATTEKHLEQFRTKSADDWIH